jgi:IS5 family transposase
MERDLWIAVVALVRSLPASRPARCQFSDARIVLVLLWAALHDRPISWACRRSSWPIHLRGEALPTPSTMTRRLRTESVRLLLELLEERLREDEPEERVHIIDGRPLPIGGNSGDPDAGFGRGAGCMAKGYKLHAIIGISGRIRAWAVRPINEDERTVACELVPASGIEGWLLGDANYDANRLFDAAAAHGVQLLAPRRYGSDKGLGHRRNSPARLRCIRLLEGAGRTAARQLLEERTRIERVFGNMASACYGLGPLPGWVRTLRRVERWVHAKIILFGVAQRRRAAA